MPDGRFEVSVTFDERGYIGSTPELRQAVVALSLGGLRRKIEIAMLPDDGRAATRWSRRAGTSSAAGTGAAIAQLDQTDCPPGRMSALGGSGRAAPREEVRVWTHP